MPKGTNKSLLDMDKSIFEESNFETESSDNDNSEVK